VVLQFGEDDFIARADVLSSVALRHQVDGLGRAANKDNLLRIARAEEIADFSRPASNNSVARVDSVCAARCMFELSRL